MLNQSPGTERFCQTCSPKYVSDNLYVHFKQKTNQKLENTKSKHVANLLHTGDLLIYIMDVVLMTNTIGYNSSIVGTLKHL